MKRRGPVALGDDQVDMSLKTPMVDGGGEKLKLMNWIYKRGCYSLLKAWNFFIPAHNWFMRILLQRASWSMRKAIGRYQALLLQAAQMIRIPQLLRQFLYQKFLVMI